MTDVKARARRLARGGMEGMHTVIPGRCTVMGAHSRIDDRMWDILRHDTGTACGKPVAGPANVIETKRGDETEPTEITPEPLP